ncbi:deoxycytidyl transferase [Coemansia sp. IMI 203386]|nr:deoxycytidyl transferase [Coemansia sp. IMI 203386]
MDVSPDSSNCDDRVKEYQLGPQDVDHAHRLQKQSEPTTGTTFAGPNLLYQSVEEPKTVVPGFGDFHGYFDQRKRKLAEQAEQRASVAPKYDQIFAGVVFHINGYTQPSHSELKLLMIERGGRFLHYLSKTQVTHIIASSLTMAKEKEFGSYKVVRPEWVVDSVKAERLVSWHRYALIGKNNTGLPTKEDFAAHEIGSLEQANWSRQILGKPPIHSGISANDSATHRVMEGRVTSKPVIDRFGEGLNREWVRKNLASDKDFIQRYYANSRLHHLSAWKAEMKDYVAKMRSKNSGKGKQALVGSSVLLHREPVIMHVDFDCFFVSASLLLHPYLKDKPVAVCHSQQQQQRQIQYNDRDDNHSGQIGVDLNSTSQIASCNYIARSFGVKNGMFMGQARQLCPGLMTVPYHFDTYKMISQRFYEIVTPIADETQAVSIDEALLDVTECVLINYNNNASMLAEYIRSQVFQETKCTVSVGIGPNILLARVATTKAKPDGVCSLDVKSFCQLDLQIRDLPGAGYAVEESLAAHGIKSVADIRAQDLQRLQAICGEKTALTLHSFSRGIDNRKLESDRLRQAFGADIGWGVRFSSQEEVDDFIVRLSKEVCRTMTAAERIGSLVTLKIKKRQEGHGKPAKFLGHGVCDSFSKSANLPQMTNDPEKIAGACIRLLQQMAVDFLDIRSVGIQVQKLNSPGNAGTAGDIGVILSDSHKNLSERGSREKTNDVFHELPTVSQLDTSVFNELPESIRQELELYYQQQGKTNCEGSNRPIKRSSSESGSAAKSSGKLSSSRGKRGRPRKLAFLHSSSSGTTRDRSKQNLFHAFQKVESLDSVMPSQMDGDTWNNLPASIRRELAREYVKTKPQLTIADKVQMKENKSAQPGAVVQDDKGRPSDCIEPELYGKTDFNDVCQLIKEWIDAFDNGPLEEDVDELCLYIEALIKHRNVFKATEVLQYFYFRCSIAMGSGLWKNAATAALERANKLCEKMYNAHIEIAN